MISMNIVENFKVKEESRLFFFYKRNIIHFFIYCFTKNLFHFHLKV